MSNAFKNNEFELNLLQNFCNKQGSNKGSALADGSGHSTVNTYKEKSNGHVLRDGGHALFRADLPQDSGKTLARRVFVIARLAKQYEQADPWMGLVEAIRRSADAL